MANTFTAFHQTLFAASDAYNDAKVSRTALLDCVYKDVKPEAATQGKTLQIPFPDLGPMQSVGNGALTADDVNVPYVTLTFQTRVGKAIKATDFERWQASPAQLMENFMKPLHARAMEYLNGAIAGLVTTTNFNASAPIIGATQGEVTPVDQLAAWNALADQRVPLEDSSSLNLLTHNNVYAKMMGDPNWVQESIAGATIAMKARMKAEIDSAFNFTPRWDQQMPAASGTIIYGDVTVTNGSAAVVGVNSAFTTDLTTAHKLVFANDPTRTAYAISAIGSDTALTLGSTYAGSTATTTARRIKALAGTVSNSGGALTGSGTAFTTALSVGDWLYDVTDPDAGTWRVTAIASNTGATIAPIGASTYPSWSGDTLAVQSYTNLALHKYAIAVALRPIATPENARGSVEVAYIDLKGIPLRVMKSYQHTLQAEFVTADFGYAIGVMRPSFGVIIKS